MEGAEPENLKYKFHFAPKLPSNCINQKCSMGVGCTFFFSLNLNGDLEERLQRLEI